MNIEILFRLILSVGGLPDKVNEGICQGGNVEGMDDIRSMIRSRHRMCCESLK
jgi:hypothetical protein